MNLLRRLIARIDDNLHGDRHLQVVPQQRTSTSPLSVMPSRMDIERIGTYPCCTCCSRYYTAPCQDLHRTPCDKPACEQDWSGGVA